MSVSSSFYSLPKTSPLLYNSPKHRKLKLGHLHFRTFTCHLHLGVEDFLTITQNKVLIAAGVSAGVGQLAKPFTSVLFYGKDFDLRTAFQAGGFPSTHSSAVIAAATCLALERGFSDTIFGMSVVYAGLVMYDAQGVRREVGIHARTLNRRLLEEQMKSVIDGQDIVDSVPETTKLSSTSFLEGTNAFGKEKTSATQLLGSRQQKGTTDRTNSYVTLKESIGHTEVEVIAGAFLGFLVSLTLNAIM